MHISRIVIRGYRNFAHLDVRLGPGVTCVLGENNTGKTNLLHALRLAVDSNLSSRWRELNEQDIHSGIDLRNASQVLVSVEFDDYKANVNATALVGTWEVEGGSARLTYRFRPTRSVREAIGSGERKDGTLTLDDYHWELSGGGATEPATATWTDDIGASIRFGHLQSFQVVFLPALRDAYQDLSQTRNSALGRLFSATSIPEAEQQEMIAIVKRANDDLASRQSVKSTGEEVQSALKDTAGEAFQMAVQLGMADPSFGSIATAMKLLLSNDSLADFEPNRNGLGLNNVLYISMLMKLFERKIAAPETAGQLLLLEEPEAHLHPQLQRVLYGALRAKPFQTIITTHSTHVSSRSGLRSTVILTNSGAAGSASCVPSSGGHLTAGEVGDLERYLDATRSTILFARKVMLVEGPAEVFLIPKLVQHVMGVDLDRLGISVVAIHGTHFDAYAKLFAKDHLPKRCAIVADGDLEPDTQPEGEGEESDIPLPTDLSHLEGDHVKVFQCATTFERAIAISGMLPVLEAAAAEVGAPKVAAKIRAAIEELGGPNGGGKMSKERKEEIGALVLRTAKRCGKARFAQVASKHAALATRLPKYIREAVEWLVRP